MKLIRDNGLTVVLLILFAGSIIGQWLTGWHVSTEDAGRHHRAALTLAQYTFSPEFLSSVSENWESEFLQMSAYVMLTTVLFQRGSAESKDPDAPPRDAHLEARSCKPQVPSMLRWGALSRALYARSLGIALVLLFLGSFIVHWTQSARAAAQEALQHSETPMSTLAYLGDSQLWFESFQNWQSEFLSTAILIVLSIFLRQKESPESKPVAAPHGQTGNKGIISKPAGACYHVFCLPASSTETCHGSFFTTVATKSVQLMAQPQAFIISTVFIILWATPAGPALS